MVALTKPGAAFFADLAQHHRDWIGEIMGGLSAADMKALYGLLAKLKQSILAAQADGNMEAAE